MELNSSGSSLADMCRKLFCSADRISVRTAGVVLFFFLILLNLDSLTAPPFWDDIIGIHTQAIWLARNNFDIAALLRMPRVSGTAFYSPTNPLCWIYGLTYSFFPPVFTHILAHLLNIAAVSACGALLWSTQRKKNFLPLLAAISSPLIVSACAGTGQETLLALLVFASCLCKIKKRSKAAWILAGIACLFKLTALTLIAALITHELFTQWQKKKLHPVKILLLLAGGTGTAIWYLAWFSFQSSHFKWKPDECLSLFANAYYLLLPMFAVSLVLLYRKKMLEKYLPIILFLFFYYTANAFLSLVSLPRYGIIIVFPTTLLFAAALAANRHAGYIFSGIIFVSLLNVYGMFLPEPQTFQYHDGSFLERSREFTLMRSQDQDFCARLENEAQDTLLVCPWPLLQMLTVPEFGYVKKGLSQVYAGEYFHPLGNVHKMGKSVMQKNPVFLYAPDCFNWQIPQQAKFLYVSNESEPFKGYILYRL